MVSERYQRLDLLGQGQMSIVWLALDTYTQERVALKIMTAILEDDRRNQHAQERFHREIEIARSLHHPHILPIRDYGYTTYENRYVPYLVSPYIQEGSLAELIKAHPPWKYWSLPQTADAIMQAADSLGYLHERNPPIVHQDVKPGNFLYRSTHGVERAAYLYLCDFGISRWDRTSSAIASELLGTFAFMAPEQTERLVDCASDQYALAVMACYMLTGKLPLQASTNELYVEAHLHEQPLPPSVLNVERINSPTIDAIILRALEKDPRQRFPTVRVFGRALQQAITDLVREQTSGQAEKDDITLLVTSTIDERRAQQPMSSVHTKPGMSISLDPPEMNEGRILDEPLPVRPLKAALPATKKEETLFQLFPMQESARIALPARPKMVSWTRDGSSLACALYGRAPVSMHRDGNIQEVYNLPTAQVNALCWSPDGRTLAVGAHGEIRFWDTLTQALLPLVVRLPIRTIEAMDWSVHEQLAVWVEGQIHLYALPHASLTQARPPTPQSITTGIMRSGNIGVLRWSPDGALLVAGASNGQVMCWSIGCPTASWQVTPTGQKVNSVAWSPDGALLAVAFRDHRVVAWNMHSRDCILQWEHLPAMPRMLSISAQGQLTIASSEQRLLIGSSAAPFPSHMLPGQLLAAWSPLRRELATLDEQKEHILTIWHS